MLQARFGGEVSNGATGAWLREHQDGQQFTINVRGLSKDGRMRDIQIQRFDREGALRGDLLAREAEFGDDVWHLVDVQQRELQVRDGQASLQGRTLAQLDWRTDITRDMVAVALVSAELKEPTSLPL